MTDDVEVPDLDPDGQLFALLSAPDRDRCPGVRPVVSVAESDEQAYIDEAQSVCVAAPRLVRRGVFHGDWVELHDAFSFVPRDPLATLAERWEEAKPIVLHDVLPDDVMEAISTDRAFDELNEPGGLRSFLRRHARDLAPEFESLGPSDAATPERAGDERDIERIGLRWRAPSGRPTSGPDRVDDLWVKTQRLSMHEGDDSLRLRLSFGEEVTDDASRDPARHRLVTELASRLLPEAAALHADPELTGLIGDWIGSRPLLTQAIAYWNAPDGGALFHHDAFDEPLAGRQRGVLYAQLTGSTAWLALSIDDLARRVLEFTELLADGMFPWVMEGRFAAEGSFGAHLALARDHSATVRELGKPGGGALCTVLDLGPEFTSLLADAGHAYVLAEGDVMLLPNHGLERTCMHSVFCAGEETGFSLSLAIREGSRAGGRRRRRGGRGGGSGRRGRPGSRRSRRR